uniref:Tetraspanin 32 n=1 Tax=Ursus maritimus TaxID=29073 RepID=A0A452TJY0_URSMA
MATLAALTYFGAHFAVIGHASSDRTPYEAVHRWAFYAAISLAGLLTLGAVLGAAATVREAGGLMAGGFLCFALVFGALAQAAFWRFHSPTQFLCCGKSSPFSLLGDLMLAPPPSQVYAMLLSAFLWFSIRSGSSLDRRGKYTLNRRAPGCQPQEPSVFRRSQGGPAL